MCHCEVFHSNYCIMTKNVYSVFGREKCEHYAAIVNLSVSIIYKAPSWGLWKQFVRSIEDRTISQDQLREQWDMSRLENSNKHYLFVLRMLGCACFKSILRRPPIDSLRLNLSFHLSNVWEVRLSWFLDELAWRSNDLGSCSLLLSTLLGLANSFDFLCSPLEKEVLLGFSLMDILQRSHLDTVDLQWYQPWCGITVSKAIDVNAYSIELSRGSRFIIKICT